MPPSGREGDREAGEGAGGYESNDLPFMRCLPLFSSVGTEMSSLLCAFSFRHPCGAGRWGKATAPCSHPGGSHSDSRRLADILPYRHLNISAYPDPIQSFNSSFFTLHYYLFTCCCCERKSSFAPPLPLSKTSALPNLPNTFFSLRRQAKHHAEGASLSACGKHHSPKANIAVQLPRQLHLAVAFFGCSLRLHLTLC